MEKDLHKFKFNHLEHLSQIIKLKSLYLNSKSVNHLVWKEINEYIKTNNFSGDEKIIINYIGIVLNLQERHRVRPFEYMDFSRRVGELWQKFCLLPWEISSNNIEYYTPPNFSEIKIKIIDKFKEATSIENLTLLDNILNIIPKINLKEDLMFKINNELNIVDFKSGFGSNEKGNTQRLAIVANVYKLIEPDTKCYLLVRQMINNNYLNHLEKSGVWKIIKGNEVYSFIQNVTNIDLGNVLPLCSNLLEDMDNNIKLDLSNRISNINKYTKWY